LVESNPIGAIDKVKLVDKAPEILTPEQLGENSSAARFSGLDALRFGREVLPNSSVARGPGSLSLWEAALFRLRGFVPRPRPIRFVVQLTPFAAQPVWFAAQPRYTLLARGVFQESLSILTVLHSVFSSYEYLRQDAFFIHWAG
jgi:hypothetical protein